MLTITGYTIIGYYIGWVIYGVVVKPLLNGELKYLKQSICEAPNEEIIKKLTDLVIEKSKTYKEYYDMGMIDKEKLDDIREECESDYVMLSIPSVANEQAEVFKKEVKHKVRLLRAEMMLTQGIYRLLAGVPLFILVVFGSTLGSSVAAMIFMVTYAVISDIILQKEEGMDNLERFIIIITAAVASQLPYFAMLVIY